MKYPELRLHREDWRITRRDVTRHLIQGIPLGLQFSVLAIGIIVMQSVIVQFDTLGGEMVSNAAQNGFGAANKLNNLLMTPLNGLGAAMTSFTAQNLGAGDHARIKKGTVQALIIVWTMCLISIAAGLLLSRGGGYLYIFLSPDKVTAETMRYGNTYLYVDLSLYLFLGFIFVVRNCVQGIGKPQFVLGAGAAELAARVQRVPAAAAADRRRRGQFRCAARGGLCPLLRRSLCLDGGGCRTARALPAQYHENGLPLPERNNVGRNKKFLSLF